MDHLCKSAEGSDDHVDYYPDNKVLQSGCAFVRFDTKEVIKIDVIDKGITLSILLKHAMFLRREILYSKTRR